MLGHCSTTTVDWNLPLLLCSQLFENIEPGESLPSR